MKILITGSSGFIGGFMSRYFSAGDYSVISTDCHRRGEEEANFEFLDITDRQQAEKVLLKFRPDIVLHLAGIKELNFCQKNKEAAYKINVEGTRNLVKVCKDICSKMVFLSSDYVFDGQKGMYREEDLANPQTYYGLNKLEAEEIIKGNLKDYLIIRSGGVFGSYAGVISPLFVLLLEDLRRGKTIEAFCDIYNTPTPLELLFEGIDKIIRSKLSGLFHIAGPEKLNRFDFFTRIAVSFGFKKELIIPVKNKGSDQAFLRPKDLSLDTSKIDKLFRSRAEYIKNGR